MPATSHRFPPNQLQVERLPILRQESTIWSPEPSVVFQFGSQIAEIIDKVWYDKSPVPFGGVSDRDLIFSDKISLTYCLISGIDDITSSKE